MDAADRFAEQGRRQRSTRRAGEQAVNDPTFLQTQVLELRRLLDRAGDDPMLAPQLRERLDVMERELEESRRVPGSLLPREPVNLARAAIFLRGGGVEDSLGIRAALAGEALIQYERMFIEQALHDEREAARQAGRQRRRRGTAAPGLLLTGTPRGSFGLEFVAQPTDGGTLLGIHAQSLRHVAEALTRVAGSTSESLEMTIASIPARVLPPLRNFLTALASHGAELRLAFPDLPARTPPAGQLQNASELLEREVKQEVIDILGVFCGVTRESGMFDLKTREGEVITGTVADELVEEDLERIDALTNQECVASLQKTTFRRVMGPATATYVLLDARPAGTQP
jgi:hypothetical protein